MEPKEKRNKEVHTASLIVPAGAVVRNLYTGEAVLIPEDIKVFAWYVLEKMQWFYWTVFMEDPVQGAYMGMIRRDKVTMVSGTHRVVHREVIQKRMAKVARHQNLENAVLPLPPKKPPVEGQLSDRTNMRWLKIYTAFFGARKVEADKSRMKWSEERRTKYMNTVNLKTLKRKQRLSLKQKATVEEPQEEPCEENEE